MYFNVFQSENIIKHDLNLTWCKIQFMGRRDQPERYI